MQYDQLLKNVPSLALCFIGFIRKVILYSLQIPEFLIKQSLNLQLQEHLKKQEKV